MKNKTLTITVIILTSISFMSCDFISKKVKNATSNVTELPMDSIESYMKQYEKDIEGVQSLASIVAEYGVTQEAEEDFPMWKDALAKNKELLETYDFQLTDEMKAQISDLNKKGDDAIKLIADSLHNEKLATEQSLSE